MSREIFIRSQAKESQQVANIVNEILETRFEEERNIETLERKKKYKPLRHDTLQEWSRANVKRATVIMLELLFGSQAEPRGSRVI